MQLISSKDYGDKKYYILEKAMDAFQQNIELGPWTAKFLAQEINDFCDLLEDQTDKCQIANITEKDVRNLVHIIVWYKQRVMEKEAIISGEHSGLDEPSSSTDNGASDESSHSE
jgi:hypothetical protein